MAIIEKIASEFKRSTTVLLIVITIILLLIVQAYNSSSAIKVSIPLADQTINKVGYEKAPIAAENAIGVSMTVTPLPLVITPISTTKYSPESGRNLVIAQIADSPIPDDKNSLWLHTEGDQIKFKNGTQIIFRGVSMYEPYLMYQYAKWNDANVARDCAELSQKWHANVIRVPVTPELWYEDPEKYKVVLDSVIKTANDNGMYVIIDWHAGGNPITGKPMLYSNLTQYPNHNPWDPRLENATKFWNYAAEHYKNNPRVIYSIFSEPGQKITWKEWRPVADTLVGTIRDHNPNALILVSGVKYAYDLSGVPNDPVRYTNIVYETHIYPPSASAHGMSWDATHAGLTGKYPVFVTEWGFSPNVIKTHGMYGTDATYGAPLLQYMEAHGYSWTAWSWSPWIGQPSMISSYKSGNYTKTEYGDFVYKAMQM